MKKYKFIDDLTSDVMFEAYGKTIEELLENSALALFEVICQIEKIKPLKSKEIVVNGKNLEELVYNWLSKLISIVDTDCLFFSKFSVNVKEKNGAYELKATAYGEDSKPEFGGTLAKAVTYYKFKVEKTSKGYMARVCLDI